MHKIRIDGFAGNLRVVQFSGWEGISELFAFEVTVVAKNDEQVPFADLLGGDALLSIDAVGDEVRFVSGIVGRLELGEEGKKLTAYRLLVVPKAERLRHRRDSRIFQELTVAEIVKRVLEAAGLTGRDFRFQLQGSYPKRSYCVQYRESDYDFLARHCEEDGIHWYFEHTEDGHVLVFADDPSAHVRIPGDATLPFRPPAGALVSGEHVSSFLWSEDVRTGKVVLRDYDFEKPALKVEATATGVVDADLEHYDYPGRFYDKALGTRLAASRQEELDVPRKRGRGASACGRLAPGTVFTLSEHPSGDLDRDYLILRVTHRGAEPQMEAGGGIPYENDFEVVRADLRYRPAQVTPKPIVQGIQTAFVVGPHGEEIYVDHHGRIKVQFHWDRQGVRDERTTCFIRVAQPWAGAGFGAMFLPRVGDEVIVSFLEGNPDRPLVTGSVYHGTNVPPYALPGNKTRSTLKSNSSPGGGGFNELRFEDRKGSEEVFVHAERDWNTKVKHDRTLAVGNNETITVTANREDTVAQNETASVGMNRTTTIGVDDTQTVGANRTVSIGANFMHAVGGNLSFAASGGATGTVDGDTHLTIKGNVRQKIEKDVSEEVSGSRTTKVTEALSLSVGKDASVKVEGSSIEEVSKSKSIHVGETYTLSVGDGSVTVEKNGNIVIKGKGIKIEGSGSINVKGSKLDIESDGAVNVKASGAVRVQGGTVDVN